jgi:hypothetical protein
LLTQRTSPRTPHYPVGFRRAPAGACCNTVLSHCALTLCSHTVLSHCALLLCSPTVLSHCSVKNLLIENTLPSVVLVKSDDGITLLGLKLTQKTENDDGLVVRSTFLIRFHINRMNTVNFSNFNLTSWSDAPTDNKFGLFSEF